MKKASKPNYLVIAAFVIAAFVMTTLLARSSAAQDAKPSKTSTPAPASNAQVARGKYIVEEVAFCINCHTPRLPNGQLDRTHWLQGTPLFFRPASPIADWPVIAPRIGGTPPGTDAEMVTLLTTGIWKTGVPLRDPMPRFRLTKEDAEAVVAYLKSLRSH